MEIVQKLINMRTLKGRKERLSVFDCDYVDLYNIKNNKIHIHSLSYLSYILMSFKWYFWQWVWEVFACLVCSGDRAQCSLNKLQQ